MYTPDRIFMTRLKSLDRRLGCYYENNHDHFVITYKRASGGTIPIIVVEDEEKGFRQPDNRDIEKLREYDTHRVSMKERLQHTAKIMEGVQEAKREMAEDFFRHQTMEDRRILAPRFARLANEGGKHNSTFRRINLKPRGKTAAQLISNN